jgi:hypothetical protein
MRRRGGKHPPPNPASTKQLGSAVGDGIAALLQVRSYLKRRGAVATMPVNA